jgi:hypothetical protein
VDEHHLECFEFVAAMVVKVAADRQLRNKQQATSNKQQATSNTVILYRLLASGYFILNRGCDMLLRPAWFYAAARQLSREIRSGSLL